MFQQDSFQNDTFQNGTPVPHVPIASFTSTKNYLNVTFTDTSTHTPTSWSWDFGDSSGTSTDQNPSYKYSTAGIYTVTLISTNSVGSSTPITHDITVYEEPTSTIYDWSDNTFGDWEVVGNATIVDDSVFGRKAVRLVSTGWSSPAYLKIANSIAVGEWTLEYYEVSNNDFVEIQILSNANLGSNGQWYSGNCIYAFHYRYGISTEVGEWLNNSQVKHVSGSTESIYGTPCTLTLRRESNGTTTISQNGHIKATTTILNENLPDGSYLVIGNTNNGTVVFNSLTYDDLSPQSPTANFTSDKISGSSPLTVNFVDTSTHTPTSWDWDFGDGSTHGTTQNPSHEYTIPGTYTVTLIATNSQGYDEIVKTNLITVGSPPPGVPVASYTTVITLLDVNFTDTSTNTPTSWLWSFGDTSTSTLQNPSHSYTAAGTYTVTLVATNAGGSSDVYTSDIVVTDKPFVITDSSGNPLSNLLFSGLYLNTISLSQQIQVGSSSNDLTDVTVEAYQITSSIPSSMQTQSVNSDKYVQLSDDNSTYPATLTISDITHGTPETVYVRCSIPDYAPDGSFLCGLRVTATYSGSTTYSETLTIQGNVQTNTVMENPPPDQMIVFEVAGEQYNNIGQWSTENRGNDKVSTFNINYLSSEDLQLFSGQTIRLLEQYGDPHGFFNGIIQDITDNKSPGERSWTLTGRNDGNDLVTQAFNFPAVETSPSSYTSNQLLSLILANTTTEIGPCVDITVTGITNQNNVFKGFAGNWDTKAAALTSLLALVSRVKRQNVNWFLDRDGLLRIFYTDIPDSSIGITILQTNPRLLSFSCTENSENIINDQYGTAGSDNSITSHLQDTDSINGWTDPDTGLIWPGYGVQTGTLIQDSSITNQTDLNVKVQNELDMHSKPIFTVQLTLSRFPNVEIGQPLYLPDHYKLRGMTFVVTAITQNGDSANRTTTLTATTDKTMIGPLSDYEAIKTVARYAIMEYAPVYGVVTDKGTGSVTVQPVDKIAQINVKNIGG